MVSLRHSVTATGTNNPDRQVSVNAWNNEHSLTGTADTFLGFDADGNAAEYTAQELHTALTDFTASERGLPVGYTGANTFGLRVYKTGTRSFTTNADEIVVNHLTVGTAARVYYVDSVNGDDANAGTSEALPKKTIASAMSAAAGPSTSLMILAKGGFYHYGEGPGGVFINATSVAIVSWDGQPVHCTTRRAGLTWTPTTNGTYSASLTSAFGNVRTWDNDNPDATYGRMGRLTVLASQAAVEGSSGGAMYHNTGTSTLYVRTHDGRAPDADIWVFDGAPNGFDPGGSGLSQRIYLENIHFWGGGGAAFSGGNAIVDTGNPAIHNRYTLKAKDCSFAYCNTWSNLYIVGAADVALFGCDTFCAERDGFAYHQYDVGGDLPNAIEVNCRAYRNGFTGDLNNNGSTTHGGMPCIRVNGVYIGNQDHNVHDVHGGDSWFLGCTAYDPQNATAGNFVFGDGADTKGQRGWLDTCTSDDATYDILGTSQAVVYTHDFVTDGNNSGPTVTPYTPA